MGVDGFFCDNSDVYYKYKKEGIYSGLVQILHGLRATGKDVVLNGGDTFAHRYMIFKQCLILSAVQNAG